MQFHLQERDAFHESIQLLRLLCWPKNNLDSECLLTIPHTDPACLPVCQTGPVVVVPEWLYSVMHCLRCHGDSQLWTTTTPLPLPYLLLFQTGLLLYSLSRIKTRLECISIDCWRDYGIRPPASLPAHSNDMLCRLRGD